MNINHLEINFQRLLKKCEDLAEDQDSENWRFQQYVNSLEELLIRLNGLTANKPSNDTLKDYSKRCDFLKQLTVLCSKSVKSNETLDHTHVLNNPGAIITKKDIKPKQIYHKIQLNKENTTRQQLIGYKESKNDQSGDIENVDMKKLLSQQQENQEKLALEMLKSVESIKNNSLIARRIVASDNIALDKLEVDADKNSQNLTNVSNKLTDRVSKSCNCWIWLMIFLITVVFVMMVLFMKLFKKKQYGEIYDPETEQYKIINNTLVIGNDTMHTIEL